MQEEFEDIKILLLDHERCRRSHAAPFMYTMYLELSANPPQEWQQIFYQQRRVPRHPDWRRAWIEHNYVILDCIPEEIEKCHLRDLKEDVKNANRIYRAWMKHKERLIKNRAEVEREEKTMLRDLSTRLDFGVKP